MSRVAERAGRFDVTAEQRIIGQSMIEAAAIELDDFKATALVIGMARLTCLARNLGRFAMEAAVARQIVGQRLMT